MDKQNLYQSNSIENSGCRSSSHDLFSSVTPNDYVNGATYFMTEEIPFLHDDAGEQTKGALIMKL